MANKKDLAPELLAEAKRLYEETLAPVQDIWAMMRISRSRFYKCVQENGWRGRRARVGTFHFARALTGASLAAMTPAEQLGTVADAAAEPVSAQQRLVLAQHIMRAAEREIDAVERILAKIDPKDLPETEQCARTVASVARTLREIAALNQPDEVTPPDEADDDPVPLDIDEFRDELARRIRGIIEARRERESGGDGGVVARIEPPTV